MSYGLKYQMAFFTRHGDTVRLDFNVEGAPAGVPPKQLEPGVRPFVLREYNSQADLFKATRGFLAEIQITNDDGTRLEDFLADTDRDIQVTAYFNTRLFWGGWLMQDDFEEPWIDTAHYITLRATDGLGTITGSSRMAGVGQAYMMDYITLGLNNTPLTSGFAERYLICNLFYEGMDDRSTGEYTALLQATTAPQTFEGDDYATILKKTLEAWGLSLYQYQGRWWMVRPEEFINNMAPVYVLRQGLLGVDAFNKTYQVNIGVGEKITPVMPEMGRAIRRATKTSRLDFYNRMPKEIVCNQAFRSGTLIPPSQNSYTIECWLLETAPISAPVPATTNFYRTIETDVDGNPVDEYAFIEHGALLTWMRSAPLSINKDDKLEFSIDFRGQRNTTTGPVTIGVAIIQLVTATGKYTLDDTGAWALATGNWAGNVKTLQAQFAAGENTADWKTKTVTSEFAPDDGDIQILLLNGFGTDTDANFKGLQVATKERNKPPGVVGDFGRYTKDGLINKDYREETFLDDANNKQLKGAIQYNNKLTGDRWYRMNYPTERLTFKRQRLIGHMLLNRRWRMMLRVNMTGLTWEDQGISKPIWLQNRFIFTDDAPTKIFMIANLEEMDFADGSWKATLLEIWDTDLDSEDPADYLPHDYGWIYDGE